MLDTSTQIPLPTTPTEIAAIFSVIVNPSPSTVALPDLATRVHHSVNKKLQAKYGHENPVDWYDHPEASILAVAEAAAARLAHANPSPAPDSARQQWKLALRGYALCTEPNLTNALLLAIDQHAGPDSTPPFIGE